LILNAETQRGKAATKWNALLGSSRVLRVDGVDDFPREKLTDRPSFREEDGRKMTGRKILWQERYRVGARRFGSTVPNQIFLPVIFLP
jgi:hypothetical protein